MHDPDTFLSSKSPTPRVVHLIPPVLFVFAVPELDCEGFPSLSFLSYSSLLMFLGERDRDAPPSPSPS